MKDEIRAVEFFESNGWRSYAMPRNSTPTPAPSVDRGYQPLREGYQPTQALSSTPPQGGSGLPDPAMATPAPAAPSVSTSTPSGSQPVRD